MSFLISLKVRIKCAFAMVFFIKVGALTKTIERVKITKKEGICGLFLSFTGFLL